MQLKTLYLKFLVVLLIGIHLLGVLRAYMPFLEYKVNYDFISEVLCINKTNQAVNCNGKCYLKNQIEKAAKETSEESKSGNLVEVIVALIQNEVEYLPIPTAQIIKIKQAINPEIVYFSLSSEITTPPPRS